MGGVRWLLNSVYARNRLGRTAESNGAGSRGYTVGDGKLPPVNQRVAGVLGQPRFVALLYRPCRIQDQIERAVVSLRTAKRRHTSASLLFEEKRTISNCQR